jgi:N-acetylmuramoyl-L-alanine amidase
VDQARALAEAAVTRLQARLGTETRPARHGNFHVLRDCPLPVVLTEASFMTNPEEAQRLDQLAYNRLEAIAIFEAVLDCYGQAPADQVEVAEEVSK